MNKIITVFALCALTCSAFSAETKEQLAEKLIELDRAEAEHRQYLDGLIQPVSKRVKSMLRISPEMENRMTPSDQLRATAIENEMAWEKTKPLVLKLYTDSYSAEEMTASILRYENAAAKAFAKKSVQVTADRMAITMKVGASILPKVTRLLSEQIAKPSIPSEIASAETALTTRAHAIEKSIINDGREIASAANQFMAENATTQAPLLKVRKYLSGEKISTGVKIGLFDPKKPEEIKLVDISSKEAESLSLSADGAFVLGSEELATINLPASHFKNNASNAKGTAAFLVESGRTLSR